jgi:hypothetical protein
VNWPSQKGSLRIKYFALGLTTTGLCFGILLAWDTLIPRLLGQPHLAYDLQPAWLQKLPRLLGYLPWLVGLVLVALKLRGRAQIRLGPYAVGAFFPLGVFSLWILSGSTVSNWWHQERFDPVRWRAPADTSEVFWPTRLRMIDDLLARKVLQGLARDSVRALLGPANQGTSDSAPTVRYYLGPERGWIRIDGEELVIQFDASGRVVDAGTVRD